MFDTSETLADHAGRAIGRLEPKAPYPHIYRETEVECGQTGRTTTREFEACVRNAIQENCDRGQKLFVHKGRGHWGLSDNGRALFLRRT